MERETGIGPASLAWKARVLPLNYSRATLKIRIRSVRTAPTLPITTQNAPRTALQSRMRLATFTLYFFYICPVLTFQKSGGWGWIRTSVRVSEQIYSLPPLATRTPILTGNSGLCHSFYTQVFGRGEKILRMTSQPLRCWSRHALASEKCPQPIKGKGGRSADSGDG